MSAARDAALGWMEAINRRDVESGVHLLADDYVFENAGGLPGGGEHRGPEGARRFAAEFFGLWASWEVTVEDVVERAPYVLVVGTARGVGAGSGVGLDIPIAYLHAVSGGRLRRTRVFLDPDQGREALAREAQ